MNEIVPTSEKQQEAWQIKLTVPKQNKKAPKLFSTEEILLF